MRDLKFAAAATRVIAVAAAAAADTGFRPGGLYRISFITAATGTAEGATACRWGANDPTAADAGADFIVAAAESLVIRVPTGVSELRAIRISAVDGTLIAQLIDEGA